MINLTLGTLTEKLSLVSEEETKKETKRRDIEKILEEAVSGRVIYPQGWEDPTVEISHMNWRGMVGYFLTLSAYPEISEEGILPLLNALLAGSRKKHFAKGTFEAELDFVWKPDMFINEISLADVNNVSIRGSFYAHDPTSVRIGFQGTTHEFELKMEDHELTISAKGDYKSLVMPIIKQLRPKLATIRFSKADANTLIEKTQGLEKKALEKLLKPKKQNYLTLGVSSGITGFGEEDVIEITVPTKKLFEYSRILDKSLIDGDRETFLVSLTKRYFLRRSRLEDMKNIVRILSVFKTSTVFGKPLMTEAEAKKMLDEEIDIISKSYENMFFFGMNTHMQRGPLVKRLAVELFGEKIIEGFDEMEPGQYLEFLKENGFAYNGELDEEHEPGYIMKEKYLLSFFKQSYAKDPGKSVEKFRNWYTNTPPKINIRGKLKIDASMLPRLSLPSYGMLTGFKLKQELKQGRNELAISRFNDEKIHFWIRPFLGSPDPILDLQEKVCDILGVKIN